LERNNETIDLIKKSGAEALIKCDVSKSSDVKAMVEKTIATFGRLDYAFNNAGIEVIQLPCKIVQKRIGTEPLG
jgi:NAD(P)-dependent dehydrogenase (short-subunit alcohol dehydrogenase family)